MKNAYRYVALGLAALSLAGFSSSAPAQSLQTLHVFTNRPDGAYPQAGLIADPQGNLYGTTYEGGIYCALGFNGCGTVFKLTPPKNGQGPWTETVLYSFCEADACFDGAYPKAGLIRDPQGALYGTTNEGGQYGYGTVFMLTPLANGQGPWTATVLYHFCPPGCTDGAYPAAGLIRDPQGALYGTTNEGGVYNQGTVFKLAPPANGQPPTIQSVLNSFPLPVNSANGDTGGSYPVAGLILDAKGALYGTAYEGGDPHCGVYGCGTVFKLTPPANGNGPGKGQTAVTETRAP
jgi:uncharacterized repeat protein (TIGR03803 family)